MPATKIDAEEPIPPYFSRYPNRSPAELQQLLKKSKESAAAGTRLLRQAASVAKLVKDDEHWITKYTEDRPSSSIANNNTKRTAAVVAAAAIAATNHQHNTTSSGLLLADGTAGHCNTNHAIPWNLTHDGKFDVESNRVRELIRNRLNRLRTEQPESRTEDKWDKPKVHGERRRRIVRDKDSAEAPTEPPPSGYTIFVFLMTTKLRHDRGPDAEHSQTAVVQKISQLWRVHLREHEQRYYNRMSEELQNEYREQMLEYRATDSFRPSERFVKLGDGKGPWVHKHAKDRNALEAEIASYETVVFPPRPPSKDEEYYKREQASKERRKEKLRMEAQEKYERKRALEEALMKEGKLHRRISRKRGPRKNKKSKQDDENPKSQDADDSSEKAQNEEDPQAESDGSKMEVGHAPNVAENGSSEEPEDSNKQDETQQQQDEEEQRATI